MITIQEVRQKFPEYSDLSDQSLADALHSKYYSDLQKDKFYKEIGLSESPNKKSEPSFLSKAGNFVAEGIHNTAREIKDFGAGVGQGLVNLNGLVRNDKGPYPDVAKEYFGLENPSTLDVIIQKAGQFSPYLLGGEALLGAKSAATGIKSALPLAQRALNSGKIGAAYGATQGEPGNRLKESVEDAALGPLFEVGGSAVAKGIGSGFDFIKKSPEKIKGYLSKYAASGLSKSIKKDIDNIKDADNLSAFNMARENHERYANEESKLWKNIPELAQVTDQSGIPFDNEIYRDALASEATRLRNRGLGQGAHRRGDEESIALLEGYSNDMHSTFSDAIEHNKALNRDYRNEITPGKSLPFETVSFAKGKIKKSIEDNFKKNNLEDTFGQAWEMANKKTAEKNKIFHEISGAKGNKQNSSFSQYLRGSDGYTDPSKFVREYVPKNAADGVLKMHQFIKMVGNDTYAKNVLAKNYFSNLHDEGVFNVKGFMSKYRNLSHPQQNLMFTESENDTIRTLGKLLDKNPRVLENNSKNHLVQHGIASIMGALGGGAFGHPVVGGGIGAATPSAANRALSRAFENPSLQNYFARYINNDNPFTKTYSDTFKKKLGKYGSLLGQSQTIARRNETDANR